MAYFQVRTDSFRERIGIRKFHGLLKSRCYWVVFHPLCIYTYIYIANKQGQLVTAQIGGWVSATHERSHAFDLPPSQDASHHQVFFISLVREPFLNLHLPLASRWVVTTYDCSYSLNKKKVMDFFRARSPN